MLRTSRLRAPKGMPSRQILWPVTVYRVEVLGRRLDQNEDPFEQLVLDCAAADERDPVRIADLAGLPLDFVEDLVRSQIAQGRLDDAGRLTEAGEAHRMGQAPVMEHVGYMIRDDVTGEPFPVFLDALPHSTRPPEEVPLLPHPARRPVPETAVGPRSRFVQAFEQDGRLRRDAQKSSHLAGEGWADEELEAPGDGRVRLLDSGTFQELLLDVWMEVDPFRYEGDGKLFAGCPFGRPALNLLFQRRMAGTDTGKQVLRELEIEARELAQRRRTELADTAFQQAVDDAVGSLVQDRPTLPHRLVEQIRFAEICYQRTTRGSDPADAAIVEFGKLAEEILWELAPSASDRPPKPAVESIVKDWPECSRATGKLVRQAISQLLPPDDEGEGLPVPGHLASESEHFATHARDHLGWPSRARVGRTRQLLPFAAAALWPDSDQARHVKRALNRQPALWGDLCRAIAHRNPAAHAKGERAPGPEKAARNLAASRQAIHRALDACFPTVEPGTVRSDDGAASSSPNPDPDEA